MLKRLRLTASFRGTGTKLSQSTSLSIAILFLHVVAAAPTYAQVMFCGDDGHFHLRNDTDEPRNIGAVNLNSANGVLVPGGASPFGIAVSDTPNSIAVATLGGFVRMEAGATIMMAAGWDTSRFDEFDVVGQYTLAGQPAGPDDGQLLCPIPEPTGGLLSMLGLLTVFAYRRKRPH